MTMATRHRVSSSPGHVRHGAHAVVEAGAGRPAGAPHVAVARPVADLLIGPTREAAVLGAFPAVVYLSVGGDRVVAVTARDGVTLPCAVVVPRDTVTDPFGGVAPGSRAWIGDGRLRLGAWTLERGRVFDPRPVVTLPPASLVRADLAAARAWLVRHAPQPSPELGARIAGWERACRRGEPAPQRAAAHALLGYGAGLTPSGDDVLAGTLAASELVPGRLSVSLARTAVEVVRAAPARTTTLSAALLRHAVRGELASPAAGLLTALGAGPTVSVAALRRLVSLGHSSGRDLALGLLLGVALACAGEED